MEIQPTDVIPQELSCARPRRASLRDFQIPTRKARIVRQAVNLIFLAAILYCVLDPIVCYLSPAVPGKFVSKETSFYGKAGRVNSVRYRFKIDDKWLTSTDNIGSGLYGRINPETSLLIHTFQLGPWRFSRIDCSWRDYCAEMFFWWLDLAFMGIFWISINLATKREKIIQEQLVQRGTPAVARIVSLGTRSFRIGPVDQLTYQFDMGQGRILQAKTAIAKSEKSRLAIVDPIIVLYDPQRPDIVRPYDRCEVVAE